MSYVSYLWAKKGDRAPAIVSRCLPLLTFRLRPGDPTAPREAHLPLLPSGPDGFRKHLPRGDRILITFKPIGASWRRNLRREFSPA